jgi:2-phosphosulfolactate phosphatase
MKLRRATLENCQDVDGVVVVIDVLRAFTTAAYAFDRGAEEILLVSTVEEAFELRERNSDCLLIGEVDGLPIDGFDLPNSPSALAKLDLSSRRLIQRTTAGTQGVVRAIKADRVLAASLCVALPTAKRIQAYNPEVVTFVETGVKVKGGGEEDVVCSDYITSLLLNRPLNVTEIKNRVLGSRAAVKFMNSGHPDFPETDLEHALQIDQFTFAMEVVRRGDLAVLRSIY